MVSCKPDSLFNGNFFMQISVVNNTTSELVIERYDVAGDYYVTKHIQEDGGTLALGEYVGNKTDDYPPEIVAIAVLLDVTIYRNVDGQWQELPSNWFENLDAFEISKEYWFSDCTVTYQISVTDEMFLREH